MQRNIENLAEETIHSVDGIKRAEARPFLLTRILARMQGQDDAQNFWSRAVSFLGRPGVALTGLLLIVFVNAAIIIGNTNSNSSAQGSTAAKDEFAINVISIYDTENQEP